MDSNGNNGINSDQNPNNLAVIDEESDGDDETQSLLHPKSKKDDVVSKDTEKPRRKVHWLDDNGDKLAQILEFQPSDLTDSDDEESDSCICTIM